MPVIDLLRALSDFVSARALRWYVFGAQAVVAHGVPRLTADVDAAVDLAGGSPHAFAHDLERASFALRFPLSTDPSEPPRLLPLVHVPSGIPLDLVITAPGLDEEFLDRAVVCDLGGLRCPVVSPEDLVAMKILAGRRKDLEDVRGVVRHQGERLDRARVHDVLAAFEAATGKSLRARLDRIVRALAKPQR